MGPAVFSGRRSCEATKAGFSFFYTARSEVCKVLFLALSVTFLFVYEISSEPVNGFAPNSPGRRAWSLARTSLNCQVQFRRPACGLCLEKNICALFVFIFCCGIFVFRVNVCFCCVRFSFFIVKPRDYSCKNVSEMTCFVSSRS